MDNKALLVYIRAHSCRWRCLRDGVGIHPSIAIHKQGPYLFDSLLSTFINTAFEIFNNLSTDLHYFINITLGPRRISYFNAIVQNVKNSDRYNYIQLVIFLYMVFDLLTNIYIYIV